MDWGFAYFLLLSLTLWRHGSLPNADVGYAVAQHHVVFRVTYRQIRMRRKNRSPSHTNFNISTTFMHAYFINLFGLLVWELGTFSVWIKPIYLARAKVINNRNKCEFQRKTWRISSHLKSFENSTKYIRLSYEDIDVFFSIRDSRQYVVCRVESNRISIAPWS